MREADAPDLRYSKLLASLQARRVHGSNLDDSGQVDCAAHVTYDVPVPELGVVDGKSGVLLTNQPRFLRYDFTPEILRSPYCCPLPPTSPLPGGVPGGVPGEAVTLRVSTPP